MFVSPGAYTKEMDFSLYAETITDVKYALVHTFNKGALDTPTLITNYASLESTFGKPINNATACLGWLAAREYLRKGNKLYATRVDSTATPAAVSGMSLPSATNDSVCTDTDGVTSVPAVRTLTSALNFGTSGVLIGDCLEIHESAGDDGFYLITLVAGVVVTIDRDWPVGSLNNQDFTVWTSKKEGGVDGVTSVPTTRTLTSAGSTFTTNGVAAGDILYIAEAAPTDGDNGFYKIVTVAINTLTVDRDWPIGSLATLDFTVYGPNSTGVVGSTAVAGEFSSAGAQMELHGVKAGDILVIYDTVDVDCNGTYLITGLKVGSTDTTCEVNEVAWAASLVNLTWKILPGSTQLVGTTYGTWCKGYGLSPLVNAGDAENFNLKTYDGTVLLETVYNMDLSNVVATMLANSTLFTATIITNRLEPCPGFRTLSTVPDVSLTLSGGDDGYTGIVSGDYIAGINLYRSVDQYEIDIISCPGQYAEAVQNALTQLAEDRADCVALVDPPPWATIDTVQEIIDYHNGVGGTVMGVTSRASSYSTFAWTWVQVYDEFNDTNRWSAPSGHLAQIITHSSNEQFPWFAPAGLNRGKLHGAAALRYSPDQDDRDSMLSSGQSVNPFVSFTGDGIYLWGQKTLFRGTTALNRLNTRLLLNYLKRSIAAMARYLVFDPNDAVLWRQFKRKTKPVFEYVMANRGVSNYRIICDSTTTTATELAQYKMVGKLFIQNVPAAEIIELQFILTPQGADFEELIMAA